MSAVPRRWPIRLVIPLLVGVLAGCASQDPSATPSQASATASATPDASPTAKPSHSATPSTKPTARPSATPAPTPSATAGAACASRTLAALSEGQRIGQLFIIGLVKDRLDAPERAAIADQHFGSMTFTTHSTAGVKAIRALTDAVQALATTSATDRVRFFIAANQEGGKIQGLAGPGFSTIPSALDQGALTTTRLRTLAAGWGRELAAAGVNLDFAPVSDVVPPGTDAQNAPIGQLQREYGHDPTTVSSHVAAFIAGMTQAGIATTAKHFPGLGRVEGNTDHTSDVVDTVTVHDDPYLAPFAKAVDSGVPFVMVSLATYDQIDPDHLAVFSPTIMGGILHDDLGFRGVVISDALGATAVKSIPPGTRAIDFITAGGDMIISNQTAQAVAMAQAVAAKATGDPAFRARIDDAAMRVLEAKETAGLLPCSS